MSVRQNVGFFLLCTSLFQSENGVQVSFIAKSEV
ncbi:MAG: hypothetical protein ACI85I_001702 [Arenicella sp.]|jgi:hypothetical protein